MGQAMRFFSEAEMAKRGVRTVKVAPPTWELRVDDEDFGEVAYLFDTILEARDALLSERKPAAVFFQNEKIADNCTMVTGRRAM